MDTEIIAKLLETINCAILIVDPEGKIILSNSKAKEIFVPQGKVKGEQLDGSPIKRIFLPDDHDIFLPNIINVTKTKGEFEGEALLVNFAGRRFFALISTSVCPLDGRQGIVFTIHDITNLKKVERLLKKSERLAFLGRMLDDISHQIRNPVLTIGGFARRLVTLGGGHERYAKVILNECGRLELLLERLSDFLRLPKPRPIPMTIKDFVDAIKIPLEEKAEAFSGQIVWDMGEIPLDLKVIADDHLVPMALVPIVENAFEAYRENEEKPHVVRVGLGIPVGTDWACKVMVIDQGMGIRPTVLPKVFDPFFTTKTGHIGMGLTIAKRIIDELSGDITIETELERGTTVEVALVDDRRRPIRRAPESYVKEIAA